MSVNTSIDITKTPSVKSVAQSIRLRDVQWDTNGQTIVWLEGRSNQNVLVTTHVNEKPRDLTSELSVKAGIGYGGGEFTVSHGHVVFVADGRLYRQSVAGENPMPITPSVGDYAAPSISPDGKWACFVHTHNKREVIGIIDLECHIGQQDLIAGDDFYMQPAWHPSGNYLAFIAWNHPQMPWDGTELRLATLDNVDTMLPDTRTVETIAGGTDVAIFQPTFSHDGKYLAYVSDDTGWGQIYLYDLARREHRRLTNDAAEHARPAWIQGMRTLAWRCDSCAIFALRTEKGLVRLWRYGLDGTGEPVQAATEFSAFENIAASPTEDKLACVASASAIPPCVVILEPLEGKTPRIITRSRSIRIKPEACSVARPVFWNTNNGDIVHGLYYQPANLGAEEVPPAVVLSHGGPTLQYTMSFYPEVQFLTSRGYAVLQVNYRGSSGHGREYMLKLRGAWGEIDRQDLISGAQYLIDKRLADPQRLVAMGNSAGGTTVLLALIHNPGFFRAGVCSYAVSNMLGLVEDTHKFEEHYLDTMIGCLPEHHEIYLERSAILYADKIRDATLLFQGADDKVVPRNQSDSIAEALRQNKVPYEYHVFEGEGHGWSKTETISAYYASLEKFLRQYVLAK